MSFASLRLRPARLTKGLAVLPSSSSHAPIIRNACHTMQPTLARSSSFPSTLLTQRWQRTFHQSASLKEANPASNAPVTKFEELGHNQSVHQIIVDTVTHDMKLDTMTPVQSLTINEALTGNDILAQAKTGTGKTLGFLLPVVQNILKENPRLSKPGFRRLSAGRGNDTDTGALIISPTRELAEQIAAVATSLTRHTSIKVQTAVGGTQRALHMANLLREGCNILVGTPGRLNDILSEEYRGIKVRKLNTLVLDEADRLLDDGFRDAIYEIMDKLPDPQQRPRQTLMFSATISRNVESLARSIMRPDLHLVKTVSENEVPTHERVKQHLVELNALENQFPTLMELIVRETRAAAADPSKRPFKAIVFINTTAEVQYFTDVMNFVRRQRGQTLLPRGLGVLGIHSKLTQSARTRTADSFRKSQSAVLLSSDVTARGMDFPGVTHVIQLGLPNESESYVHRLGRTARAGAEGEGWLLVARNGGLYGMDRLMRGMPLQRNTSLESAMFDFATQPASELDVPLDSEPEVAPIFYNAWARAAARSMRRDGYGAVASILRSATGGLIRHEQTDVLVHGLSQWARAAMDESVNPRTFENIATSGRRPPSSGGAYGRSRTPMSGGGFDGRRQPPMSGGGFDGRRQPPMSGRGFDGRRQPPVFGGGYDDRRPPPRSDGGRGAGYTGSFRDAAFGQDRNERPASPYGRGRGGSSREMRF